MLVDARTLRRATAVRARILAHDDADVRVLAADAGISPSRLIRVFAALFGTTPHRLRTRVRLQRAREMLAAGDDVTTVCMALGFSSLPSFSALFARSIGVAPSRYRARAQVAAPPPPVPGCFGLMVAAQFSRSTPGADPR